MVTSILTSAQRGAGVPLGEGDTVREVVGVGVTLRVAAGLRLALALVEGVGAWEPLAVAVAVMVEVTLGEAPADSVVVAEGEAAGVDAAVPEAVAERAGCDALAVLAALLVAEASGATLEAAPVLEAVGVPLPVRVTLEEADAVGEALGVRDMTWQAVVMDAGEPPKPHTAVKARGAHAAPPSRTTSPAEVLEAGHTSALPAAPAASAGVKGGTYTGTARGAAQAAAARGALEQPRAHPHHTLPGAQRAACTLGGGGLLEGVRVLQALGEARCEGDGTGVAVAVFVDAAHPVDSAGCRLAPHRAVYARLPHCDPANMAPVPFTTFSASAGWAGTRRVEASNHVVGTVK